MNINILNLKNAIAISLVVTCTNFSFAQEVGRFRGGLETGFAFHEEFMPIPTVLAMELKYNFYKNMNVGLKTEAAVFRTCKCYDLELLSVSATYDYYFHYKNSIFSPFIGAGLGYYFARGHEEHTETHFKYNNPTGFVRAGLEIWKIRASFAYNLTIKPKKYNNRNIDYMSLTIGFYIGGGKWKQKSRINEN
jgi:outer membrane protein W